MKKLKRLIAGLLIFTPAVAFAQITPAPAGAAGTPGAADNNSFSGYLVNAPGGLSSNVTPSIDLAKYDASKVSAQVLVSSVIFNPVTFTDGTQSISSVSVVAYAGLSTAAATAQATVVSTSSLGGAQIRVNNNVLVNGTDWFTGATKHATAVSLAAAIALVPNMTAAAGGGTSAVVYATATPVGSYANTYAFTSNNSSVTMSGATFGGGQDNAVLTINGVAITQGGGTGQWAAATSNNQTATNLAAAIVTAVPTLNASASGSVVYSTSVLNGTQYNYVIKSSTQNSLQVNSSGNVFQNGTNPTFNLGSATISSTSATNLVVGLPVLFSSASATGANITLLQQTTYYAAPVSSSQFQLVKYATSAIAGGPLSDFVTITSTNSQTVAHTYTITPLPWTAGASTFTWQSSNDNANWFTSFYTGNVSTGSVQVLPTTPATTDMPIDFGVLNFRYLRLNFVAPATGAVKLVVPVNIKQDGIGRF